MVRELARRDFEGTLAALRAIGFAEVELFEYPAGVGAADLRATLQRVGLAAPSTHVGLARLRDDWEATLDFAAAVGHRYIVLASIPEADRRTVDQYRRIAELLNRCGDASRRHGITLGYHNHAFELKPLDGVNPLELLLADTSPDLVVVELDIYWAVYGGLDPVAFLSRAASRVPLVHVKDMERGSGRGFTELGRGRIDFPSILPAARKAGTVHFFYEQDRTAGSPLESARASYGYLSRLDL
jgi:sugar phosphate isomerase/epimerase